MSAGNTTAEIAASHLALQAMARSETGLTMALRVRAVFPREKDSWKRVLRHADRIVPTAG